MSAPTIAAIVRALGETYTDEGVDIWLRSENAHLYGRRPIILLASGNAADRDLVAAAVASTDGFDPRDPEYGQAGARA